MTPEERIAAVLVLLDKPRACVADLASVDEAIAILRGEDGLRAGDARVIAAFPATGKSYLASMMPGVVDSDSSAFSWQYSHPDVRERNPDWPANYIAHIRERLASDARRVLVSTHAEVRNALVDADIPFTLVYPRPELREEYRERMQRRGSPAALVTVVIDKLWDAALQECAQQQGCQHVVLGPGEYLSDALRADGLRAGEWTATHTGPLTAEQMRAKRP